MRNILKKSCVTLSVMGLGALMSVPAMGATIGIVQHNGSTNPTTEGWTLGGVAPTSSGSEGGVDFWNLGASVSVGFYQNASPLPVADTNNGWAIRTSLRVVDPKPVADSGLGILFGQGGNRYWLGFGLDTNGNMLVNLLEDGLVTTTHTIATPGTGNGYHLVELIDAPSNADGAKNGVADLYVDGVEIATGYTGFGSGADIFFWGDLSGTSAGNANYATISLDGGNDVLPTVIPEPASLALLVIGGALALPRRKKA